jgi:hypothetical protein
VAPHRRDDDAAGGLNSLGDKYRKPKVDQVPDAT